MAELIEKSPRLSRIIDPQTGRDLLVHVHPLEAEPPVGGSVTVAVRVENGPEAPIELTVTADRGWLRPRRNRLSLLGGEAVNIEAVIDATGAGEFASLCLAWEWAGETCREHVLVWRKGAPGSVGKSAFTGGYDLG